MTIFSLGNVDRCPHCTVAKPLLIAVWQGVTERSDGGARTGWGAFRCTACGGIVTASASPGTQLDLRYPRSVFPSERVAHVDVPDVARRFLQQAMDTLHAPDAAAVMAGSAVDAMLKERGFANGSLYQRIDQAKDQHILTEGMAEWAHSVRLGSNRPRHADADKPHVSPEEARQSVDFAEALGQFLFVLEAQVARGIAAAEVAPAG